LKLTGKHFIYRDSTCQGDDYSTQAVVPFDEINWKPVFAEKVTTGDCLYVVDTDSGEPNSFIKRRGVEVSVVQERGFYAPMTSTGEIVVDGVLTSCYTVLHSTVMQHTFFSVIL